MNVTQSGIDGLIVRAKSGDSAALGELLEKHRGYLRVLAQRMLGDRFRARLDASDVIQQTCLAVQRNFPEFRGETPGQFIAWLRQVHEGHIRNALREHLAGKRGVGREGGVTAAELESLVEDSLQSTPSQRVLRDEQAVLLAAALDRLPDGQREAVRLRYLEGLSLKEIADLMNRTERAAGALILRGLAALRNYLEPSI